MSEIRMPRFRVTRRRYSSLKQTLSPNGKTEFTPSHSVNSSVPEGEAFYQQMFENNRAVKMVVDPSTAKIIKVNQAACDFYGYTADQFKSLRVSDITVLPEIKLVDDMQRTIVEKGSTFEARHRLASGEIRDVEIFSGSLEFNHKPYLYAIIQDITARKQAEKALREGKSLYQLLVRNIPNSAVFIFDLDMRYKLADGPYLQRYGRLYDNVIGKTIEEALPPEAAQFITSIVQRALKGEAFSYERDHHNYSYQAFATPLVDDDGQIVGVLILSHDITESKNVETALRESEALFHSLVDLAPVGIIQTDTQGKRVFCNSHWCEMTGITLEQALGDVQFETIYFPDLKIASDAWREMMKSNLPFDNVVFRYQRPDKSTIWVSGNGRPLFDTNGKVTGYLGTVTDISDHKQLEEELITSHTRFRNIIDFAPVGIVETNAIGDIMLVNMQWSHLSGISETEAFNGKDSASIHPDDLERIQAIQKESLERATPVDNVIYRFLHSNGEVVWVSDSSRPIFNESGEITGHIITMTDITERRSLETALRQNEERLRNITDNLQDMISQSDANGLFTFASPSYYTTLGYEVNSLIGTSAMDMIHFDDLSKVVDAFQNAYQDDTHRFSVECRLRHADGHYIDVEIVGKLFFDPESAFLFNGGVFINRDISERKRMQSLLLETQKLHVALEKESELSTLKTRMMERIAHEFRTPLTVIQATTETLTYYFDRLSVDQRNTKAITIKGQIQRLTEMLQEIGIVINGSFSPERVRRTPTDLNRLCRELAAELERQFNTPGKYVLDMPDTVIANIDPHVSRNAIMHIMRNAARFSDPSSVVTINLSYENDHICLQIIDTGIGIPSLEQIRLFDPFYRGSNIGERSGLGIGLTIARAALEAQEGTIEIESAVEQGTTVTICFPKDKS